MRAIPEIEKVGIEIVYVNITISNHWLLFGANRKNEANMQYFATLV